MCNLVERIKDMENKSPDFYSWGTHYDNDESGQWLQVGPAKICFGYNDFEGMVAAYSNAAKIAALPLLLEVIKDCISDYPNINPATIELAKVALAASKEVPIIED